MSSILSLGEIKHRFFLRLHSQQLKVPFRTFNCPGVPCTVAAFSEIIFTAATTIMIAVMQDPRCVLRNGPYSGVKAVFPLQLCG